jgi:putative membrane protein
MIEHADLPALNAVLNALAATAIALGWRAIKRRRETVHKRWMLAAVALSACFLVSYLAYHFGGEAKRFPGTGIAKTLYLVMLFTHVVLAAAVVPLVLVTVFFALRDQRLRHKRLARWTLPIWLYVSVTGVLVYLAVHVVDWG